METDNIPGVSVGRRLAVGGMGELHLAQRPGPDGPKPCVVKRLLPRASDEACGLFAREVEVLRALTQAGARHVVHLVDAGPTVLAPAWFVMDHIDGVDLASLVAWRRKRGRPLPLGAVLALADGLTAALVELASTGGGIVHRDLHPGNVMIGRDGRVVLVDFGVASLDAASRTAADPRGTVAWMAPEQLRGARVGPTTDVWAVALVLWEALTGVAPRPEAPGLAALLAYRAADAAPPSHHRPEVGAALDGLVLAGLAADPARRPDAVGWRAAWEAVLGDADRALLGRLAGQVADAGAEVRASTTVGGGLLTMAAAVVNTPSFADAPPADVPSAATDTRATPAEGAGIKRKSTYLAGSAALSVVLGVFVWALASAAENAPAPSAMSAVSRNPETPATTNNPQPFAPPSQALSTPTSSPTPALSTPTSSPTPALSTPTSSPTPVLSTPTSSPTPVLSTPTSSPTPALSTPTSSPTPVLSTPTSSPTPALSTPTSSPTPALSTPTSSPTPVLSTPTSSPTPALSSPTPDPTKPPPAALSPDRDTPSPGPTRQPRAAAAAAVRVEAIGGPVHVSAGTQRGLAPLTGPAVAPGDSMLFKLTGASPAMVVHARLNRTPDGRFTAAFGAPSGAIHQVACGSTAARPTPVPAVAIPSTGLTCRFEAADGRTFTARLGPVPAPR